jgi:midasin (ATPase involved in ribosome maturation)
VLFFLFLLDENDNFSVDLMTLFESREYALPGRGETLKAHTNFQIFATTSFVNNPMPKGFQESLWTKISLHSLNKEEIKQVVLALSDRIPLHLVETILSTYHVLCDDCKWI